MRQDRLEIRDGDGDALAVIADDKGLWVEVEERVGESPVRTVDAGPFAPSDAERLYRMIGRSAGMAGPAERLYAAAACLGLVAGPSSLLLGLGLDDALRLWIVVGVVAAIVMSASRGWRR